MGSVSTQASSISQFLASSKVQHFPLEVLSPVGRQGKRESERDRDKRETEREVNIISALNRLELSHMALPNFKGVA